MNANVGALQNSLEDRVRKGRHPWEAAGELRWLTGLERSQGLLSNQTEEEMIEVIDEWLAQRMNIPEDELHVSRALAGMYGRFLAERVTVASLNPPPWEALENAWREWRARGRRGAGE